MRPDGPIRVLLIDDALLLRRAVAAELDRASDLHTVACGSPVDEVRAQLLRCHPEVLVLDLGRQANEALRLLVKLRMHYPVPIVVTVDDSPDGVRWGLRAVRLGAIDVIRRPSRDVRAALEGFARELAAKVRMCASAARPVPRLAAVTGQLLPFSAAGLDAGRYVVAIGASTGGTEALAALFRQTPTDFPPVVIVQHMPVGFTHSFAQRLNSFSPIRVTEAVDGDRLRRGCALLARGDTHIVVRAAGSGWVVRYTHQELVNRHCPSVDVLFESVAASVGNRAVGVLLTGMGADGAHGLLKMRQAGALTVAQTEATSVVYGMPKEAVKLGAVLHSAAPHEIPALIARRLQQRDHERAPHAAVQRGGQQRP